MRRRRGFAALAVLALFVAVVVHAADGGQATGGRSVHDRSAINVAVSWDDVAHATPAAPQHVRLLDAGIVVYLAVALSIALAFAFSSADGLSFRALIMRAGRCRRVRAPPATRS
jgi:hypothetical protein